MSKENAVQMVRLVFEVPLNEVEVTTSKDGAKFYRLPYAINGTFGKLRAYLRGSKITIPVDQTPKAKTNGTKQAKLSDKEMAAIV